jgi:hypothetical protein
MANWFASPAMLWLGLLIGPLLLLYMLRHKPVRKRVPSVVLWTGVAQSQIATSPFQRLRRSLSLLLMLLALTALVLALAGFRIPGGEQRGVPLTVIVDVTASMGANETGGRRIDVARQRAEDLIDAAGNSDISLFAWDGNLRALAPADVDPAVAIRALDQLEPADYGASDSALVRALEQLTKDANRRVVLVSDHSPGQLESALFVQAGQPKMNVGVVSASLSEVTSSQIDLFFGIDLNGSDKPVRAPLVLERVRPDGSADLVDARDVDLLPGRRSSVTFSGIEPGLYAMRVKLEDALELDNVAWLRLSRLPVQDVVITGVAPAALLRAVEAIQEANQVIRLVPTGTEDKLNASYVFTDAASSGAEPRLPSAYLAPEAAPRDVRYGDITDVTEAATRPAASFLWRGAGTPDLRVPKVYEVETNRYLRPVLEAGTGPAIALTTRDNDLHDMLVAFPLDETATGFSGRVAFLIFWANWFDYVRRAREPLPRGAVGTRQGVSIRPLAGRGEFRYGRAEATERDGGSPGRALQFDSTGVYLFEGLDDTDLPMVGVSLLDASESNLSLPDPAGYDGDVMRAWMRDFEGEGERRDLDLRPWLALVAGALLLFDWYWFRRKFPIRAEAAAPSPKTQTAVRGPGRATGRSTSRVLP